jgi:hypothetical protein
MKKRKKTPALAGVERQRPRHGGSFVRCPETGKLDRIEHTRPRAARAEAEAPAEAEQAQVQAGDDAALDTVAGDAAASDSSETEQGEA